LVYSSNGKLNIRNSNNSASNDKKTYQLITLDGKMITEQVFNNDVTNKSFNIANDIYLIKIIDSKEITTYKVWLYQ
jgi:hypothetical protein